MELEWSDGGGVKSPEFCVTVLTDPAAALRCGPVPGSNMPWGETQNAAASATTVHVYVGTCIRTGLHMHWLFQRQAYVQYSQSTRVRLPVRGRKEGRVGTVRMSARSRHAHVGLAQAAALELREQGGLDCGARG